jgi:hypothetical protein
VKKKRGFSQERAHIQNPLSFFTQVSWFGRYKQIFTTHFLDLKIMEFPVLVIIFGHKLRGYEEVF